MTCMAGVVLDFGRPLARLNKKRIHYLLDRPVTGRAYPFRHHAARRERPARTSSLGRLRRPPAAADGQ